MTVLSKFVAGTLGWKILNASCYESGHTWNPNCELAIKDAVYDGLVFSFKTYFPLYLIAAIAAKKDIKKAINYKLFENSIRSTIFLTCNMCFYVYSICLAHRLLGFTTVPTAGILSACVASFLAILIEKPSRRHALAVYLTNLATETLYRQGMAHGYLPRIPKGEMIPFAIGLGGMMYYYKRKKLDGFLNKMMEFIFRNNDNEEIKSKKYYNIKQITILLTYLRKNFKKSNNCDHKNSCVSHALEGSVRNFSWGMAASVVLAIVGNIKNIPKQPSKLITGLFSKKIFKIPLFLSVIPAIQNSVQCILNRYMPERFKEWNPVIGAATSALSFPFFPNLSVALYFFWKFIESFYKDMYDKGYFPNVKNWKILLYTISTGYVLSIAVFEPHLLRKGYYNFLDKLTGTKIRQFNRRIYDHVARFGLNSNLLFESKIIEVNTKYALINPVFYLNR
uniref:TMEM135_C_rich domain-containing protein n=1 Tax=Parastrongyloides trichosuri TaxID=131310 RepID=A0A0N5A766_PARTI